MRPCEQLVPATVTTVATRAELGTALYAEEAHALDAAAGGSRSRDVATVGIDAEPAEPLPPGMLAAIARADERHALAAHGAGACWDRLLLSAKESVFKAWLALTGRMLGFEDADVRIDPRAGTFSARLLVAGALDEVRGRWIAADGIGATAVVVAR